MVYSNGKSKLLELFAMAFGEYADTFPITLFTGKRARSEAATPEVAQSKGKRFMQVDEPEEGAHINVGLMKQFTGGDKIKARGLFKDPIEFKPQFKIILVCNDLPQVPPYDGGVWRRLEVVEFISKFVEDVESDEYIGEENVYPRDDQLSEKLKTWKETFMSMLLEYYKLYKQEGLKAPEEVTKYTKEFQKTCDVYGDFIAEKLEQVKDLRFTVTIGDAYREFKLWHNENNIQTKMIGRKELGIYLEKKFKKKYVSNDVMKGFKIRSKDEKKISDIRNQERTENDEDDDDVEMNENEQCQEVEINANTTQPQTNDEF